MKKLCTGLLAAALCFGTPPIVRAQETETRTETSTTNIISMEVQKDGQPLDAWKQNESASIKLILKNNSLKTSDVTTSQPGPDPAGISADRLSDGFTAGDKPEIILDSQPDQPLGLTILFPNVKWKGKDDLFSFLLETDGRQEKLEVRVYEVTDKQQEPEPEPEPEPVPDPGYTGGSIDYGGGSDPVKIASASPNLIVSKYSYGKDKKTVEAGTDFTLELQIRNTSSSLAVENIVVSCEPEGGLSIAEGSNSFYYDTIGAGQTKTLKLKMRATLPENGMNPALNLNFSYEYVDDSQRLAKTSTEKITIPVQERDRMEITAPENLEPAFAGQEYTISFPYVNKGKGTLYNVSMKAEGKGFQTLVPVQNLGNFEPGRSGTMDMVVIPDAPGQLPVKVIITYENADEKETKKEFEVKLDVQEAMPANVDMTPPEEEKSSPAGWIAALAVTAAVIGFVVYRHRKKKSKETAGQEDLDALFDDKDPK